MNNIIRLLTVLILLAVLVTVLVMPMPEREAEPPPPDGRSRVPAETGPPAAGLPEDYIWIDRERLMALPTDGPAWEQVLFEARLPLVPDLSNQDDPTNVRVLAAALVFARAGDEDMRERVVQACLDAIGTERGSRTLHLGKELAAYVLAADLVGMPDGPDTRFRTWLEDVLDQEFPSGKTLRSTHEDRPNNWGTYAGASRMAVAAYLEEWAEFERATEVFKGWLGDRTMRTDFEFKDRDWQADPFRPVGINPAGSVRSGHSVDGVLPDDQRRGGGFRWPPPKENYVYSALQGAIGQAILLHRAGHDVWAWEDRALLRAFEWLHQEADYPAEGDDGWLPHVINFHYDTDFPAPVPAEPGKNLGWTDWTHGPAARGPAAAATDERNENNESTESTESDGTGDPEARAATAGASTRR